MKVIEFKNWHLEKMDFSQTPHINPMGVDVARLTFSYTLYEKPVFYGYFGYFPREEGVVETFLQFGKAFETRKLSCLKLVKQTESLLTKDIMPCCALTFSEGGMERWMTFLGYRKLSEIPPVEYRGIEYYRYEKEY